MKNTENLWNWIGVILLQCNSMSLNTVSIWYIEITSVLYGAGFEYQRLRFENNYSSVTWADHQLIPIDLHENDKIASVKRSSFKTFSPDHPFNA